MTELLVKDVMTHLVVTMKPGDPLEEAAARLARNHVSGLPVVEDGRVVGIVSESDIVRAGTDGRGSSMVSQLKEAGGSDAPTELSVEDVMNRAVVQIGPQDTVWEAARLLTSKGVNRLPVAGDDGRLIGIVTRADVVRAIVDDGVEDDNATLLWMI